MSPEDAAERRIAILLARERELRDGDADQLLQARVRVDDEGDEERFWDDDELPKRNEDDETLGTDSLLSPVRRAASIWQTPVELELDDDLLEEVVQWFLEVSTGFTSPRCLLQPDYMRP